MFPKNIIKTYLVESMEEASDVDCHRQRDIMFLL